MKQKVLMAMSGGVDSSTAALLLQEAGYDVVGVTLKMFENKDKQRHRGGGNRQQFRQCAGRETGCGKDGFSPLRV